MKMSRWKMICGLKEELFSAFSIYLYIVVGILFLYTQHFSKNSIIFVCIAETMMIFLYIINGYGYVIDIILKNVGETGWISGENIEHVCVISGPCHRSLGCEIKVFEEGKKPIKLKVFEKLSFWPEGKVIQFKIYYLKNCKAVVGWDVVREKIDLSRKPRKSK